MNGTTEPGAIPANVSLNMRATVTASTGDEAAFKAARTSLGQGLAAVSRDAAAI
jgi:hypothetical protein